MTGSGSDRRDDGRGLYRVAPWVVVRTPALPAGRIELARDPRLALDDPQIVRALAIGCPDLLDELRRESADPADRRRSERSLARYLIRMSTRPTPFGAFAAVSMAQWGDETTLSLGPDRTIRTRPDMAWVVGLLRGLEADPDVRARCRWQCHPLTYERNGRIMTAGADGSVRATPAARAALAASRRPLDYTELAATVRQQTGGSPQQVDALLTELWSCGLLLTDLRPVVTDASATSGTAVAETVRRLRPETSSAVGDLLRLIDAFDRAEPSEAPTRLAAITEAATSITATAISAPAISATAISAPAISGTAGVVVQTDLERSLAGVTLDDRVAAECARAAQLLLRIGPAATGSADVTNYTRAFMARYGEGAEVSLPEVFDPVRGLGPMPHTHAPSPAGDAAREAARAEALMNLALGAMRDRRRTVELDKSTIEVLQTWQPHAENAPLSLDLAAFVTAPDPAAIDRGDFTIVVGPNLGASSAGRWLGRFAHLFPAQAEQAYGWLLDAEDAARPGSVPAEVVYLPDNPHSANVVLRTATAPYEIMIDRPVEHGRTIGLDDLVVGVRAGRLYLHSRSLGHDVRPTARHMLNQHGAPSICQFLDGIGRAAEPTFSGFDWGPAISLPCLPRVSSGRVVLEPARWLVSLHPAPTDDRPGDHDRFRSRLADLRERWDIPSRVYVSTADNRMLLDLNHADDVEQLRPEARAGAGRSVRLEEALPDVGDAWLPGPDGGYLCEIVVSLVLRPADTAAASHRTSSVPRGSESISPVPRDHAPGDPAPRDRPLEISDRVRPPGSDWLFVKLYLGDDDVNRLLCGPVGDLLDMVENSGLSRRWFFIRYADPEPHLRIRWQGEPDVLLRHLLPPVTSLGDQLIRAGRASGLVIDTYERELERYGGPAATDIAEDVFHADSRAVRQLLQVSTRAAGPDPTELAALTVHDLLAGLGLDGDARLAFYERQCAQVGDEATRRNAGADFRQRKVRLRQLLGADSAADPAGDAAGTAGEVAGAAGTAGEVAAILSQRRVVLGDAAARLENVARDGAFTTSFHHVRASFVHMHLNRLCDAPSVPLENLVLHLLARVQKSLLLAPPGPVTAQAPSDLSRVHPR